MFRFVHQDVATINVTTSEGEITSTINHAFYVEDKGWLTVGELHEGDCLRTPEGRLVEVVTVQATGKVRLSTTSPSKASTTATSKPAMGNPSSSTTTVAKPRVLIATCLHSGSWGSGTVSATFWRIAARLTARLNLQPS